jgi:hypothetical protein
LNSEVLNPTAILQVCLLFLHLETEEKLSKCIFIEVAARLPNIAIVVVQQKFFGPRNGLCT